MNTNEIYSLLFDVSIIYFIFSNKLFENLDTGESTS